MVALPYFYSTAADDEADTTSGRTQNFVSPICDARVCLVMHDVYLTHDLRRLTYDAPIPLSYTYSGDRSSAVVGCERCAGAAHERVRMRLDLRMILATCVMNLERLYSSVLITS